MLIGAHYNQSNRNKVSPNETRKPKNACLLVITTEITHSVFKRTLENFCASCAIFSQIVTGLNGDNGIDFNQFMATYIWLYKMRFRSL